MREITLSILFFLLFSLSAFAANEESVLLKDQADMVNYSYGHQLGRELLAAGIEFKPELLWQALNEGLVKAEPQPPKAGTVDAGQTSTVNDGVGYNFGYQLGTELTDHRIEFRASALWQGLYDAIGQVPPSLEEAKMALLVKEARLSATVATTGQIVAAKNEPPPKVYRLKGQRFIGENLNKEGVISLTSGLQYKVLKSGAGKKPRATDAVLVNYRAKTIEGKEFSNSYPLGIPTPQEFTVNKVIPGWTEALQLMREGDTWELYIPTRLAYKDAGPMAGQTVIFVLELLEILPEFR